MLSDDDLKKIATTIAENIGSRLEISRTEHDAHHRFVQTLIDEANDRRELWLDMRKHLMKWGMFGLIGVALTVFWFYLTAAVRSIAVTGQLPPH